MRKGLLLLAFPLMLVVLQSSPAPAVSQTSDQQVTSLGDGVWSYFGDPRAVYANDTTFVGWVTSKGDIVVASIRQDVVQRHTLDHVGRDDHSNPSLFIRPGGRIVAVYAPHGVGAKSQVKHMYYRVSVRPYDVTAWGPIRRMPANSAPVGGHPDRAFSYPNPIQMPNGRVWLFWRGGSWWPTVSITSDWQHWTRPRTVVTSIPGQRPYAKYAGDGKSVYMAFSRSHPMEKATGIYFLRISKSGAEYRSDGTRIGSLNHPPSYARATPVYRYSASGGRAWPLDIALDSQHRPVVVYQRRDAHTGDTYRYAWWDGTKWVDRVLVPAGQSPTAWSYHQYYQGGVTLDHDDPSIAYVSRRPFDGSPYEIEIWTTPDHGSSWAHMAVTEGSSQDNWRPVGSRGYPGGTQVFWWRGRYATFRDYNTEILRNLKRQAAAG
ncbi:MAG: hypothetical protein QOK25_1002 [Thermoleophilaceae bacterium]|jgi:hypothetical protein|nr:hypothetical protein [Thermoleophilaceae bacterium]